MGHLALPADSNELPVALWKDAKSSGFPGLGSFKKVSSLALNFPTAKYPASFAAFTLLGTILGDDSPSITARAFAKPFGEANTTLAQRIAALDGAAITVGDRVVNLKLHVISDYAELGNLLRLPPFSTPFPNLPSQTRLGLAAGWYNKQICCGCTRTVHEMYESSAAEDPVHRSMDALIQLPRSRFVYGRLHGFAHLVGGFTADVCRAVQRISPGTHLTSILSTLYHDSRVPRTERTYHPLFAPGMKYSKHLAQPTTYASVFDDRARYDEVCAHVDRFFNRPSRAAVLAEDYGLDEPWRIARAMIYLRDLYQLARTDPTDAQSIESLADQYQQRARFIDHVWLKLVRGTAPPGRAGPLPVDLQPTYVPQVTGRGVANHFMLHHYHEQMLTLGPVSARLSDQGGENINNLLASAWGHGNLGSVSRRRSLPRLLLRRSLCMLFSRTCTEPTLQLSSDVGHRAYHGVT